MPSSISALASAYMKLPLRIEIAPQGTSSETIEQEIIIVPKHEKIRLLESILTEYIDTKVLIFSRTKHGAKKIANEIREMGHTATEIHSNRTQAQRVAALQGFTKGKFKVMVATDIAARGIDVKDIGLVINFDLPENSEDYVHRIGRTGRAGQIGKAISFVTPAEKFSVKKIERLIRKTLPILAMPVLPPERERIPFQNSSSKSEQRPRHSSQRQTRNNSHGNRFQSGNYRRRRSK
jgi:ATP-dependent RNA helicase RhlE